MHNHQANQLDQAHSDRWSAVDSYLNCISECDLNDGTCITRCLVVHLKEEEEPSSDC